MRSEVEQLFLLLLYLKTEDLDYRRNKRDGTQDMHN